MANENHTDVNALWPGDGFGAKMNDKPLVSVIIPVFNLESYLGEAVDSVLNQTCQDFEIIMVDDGSTDSSREIMNGYQCRLPEKVRSIFLGHRGAAAARNAGIAMAAGKWIAFLDGDDQWLPSKLEKQLNAAATNPQLNFIATAAIVLGTGRLLREPIPSQGDLQYLLLIEGCFILLSSVLLHRSLLAKIHFDESLPGAQDFDLYLRLADQARFLMLTAPLVHYRIRPGAISDPKTSHFLQLHIHYQLIKREKSKLLNSNFSRYHEIKNQLSKTMAALTHLAAYYSLTSSKASISMRIKMSLCAIRKNPFNPKNFRFLFQSFLPRYLNLWLHTKLSKKLSYFDMKQ